jgi:hypothetical protein
MLTILLGILSSTFAEVITAINKRLQGTLLQGDGAFLVAFGLALPAAALKEVLMPGFEWQTLLSWPTLVSNFTEIFAVSQVYFLFVAQKLNLDVGVASPNPTVGPAPASTIAPVPVPASFAG